MLILTYSLALAFGLLIASPWWLVRMFTTDRYWEGLGERLGRVPAALREAAAGKKVIWLHAVSVGEVLAATRLVAELEAALGEGWLIAISTTTRTGQKLARERFGADRVFYFPLDFAFATRAYLNALQPAALLLTESELWPRLLHECTRRDIPAIVVNARVSDLSFARALKFRGLWQTFLGKKVTLFLAQSEQDAQRLRTLGAPNVQATGNLKYDILEPKQSTIAEKIVALHGPSRVIVAGSTLENEEELILNAWPRVLRAGPDFILVIAPRHPERFSQVHELIQQRGIEPLLGSQLHTFEGPLRGGTVILLDTIGDLASVYKAATVAFIGGSLVQKGGHNPLEATRFGVRVVMGKSYENFREIVEGLDRVGGVHLIKPESLDWALIGAARNGKRLGRAGKAFTEAQQGATTRATTAILKLVQA